MPLGAGNAPAGSAPAGFGSPDVAASPTAGAIYVDAQTGLAHKARKIDQRSRQYVFDVNGRIQGMPGIYQMVQLRIMTLRGTSAVKDLGLTIANIQVIGTNIQRQIENAFNVAMKDLVDQKLMQIVSIKLDRFSTSGEYITFVWRDLTAVPAVEVTSKV